mmetsp:Transcript_9198/g.20766  ORF Transcript_9198/g.20766 Transcript_9198/m.20766 type:complete len:379 (-) Transcript_9198:335-1471(-)|eukprot:CAMPEP_0172326468 /NCGR_PEP_ID=MMETSP1058-20130122/56610_1 /TAXON_ID=83371 /ORGANISM="Detonula confervacea, Strain CCMP 353" /LENGTH=378 /DNA_ID=CAMNT_0013043251 /DNA_START=192 /DNA_END=1328 /DNA_ORIENTATION=-
MATKACLALFLLIIFDAGKSLGSSTSSPVRAVWDPRRRAVPEKAPRAFFKWPQKGIERKNAESISSALRLRNAFLHVIYMVLASEFLTQLSIFLSFLLESLGWSDNGSSSRGIVNDASGWMHMCLPTFILVGLNIHVWTLWEYCDRGTPVGIDGWKKLDYPTLVSHFTCISDPTSKRRAQRPHTVLTQAFSQQDSSHLLNNMISLSIFAPWVLRCMGTYRLFFYFYVGSIYFSQFFEDALICWSPEKPHWDMRLGWRGCVSRQLKHLISRLTTSSGLGASGAVSAVKMFFYLSFGSLRLSTTLLAISLLLGDLLPLWSNQLFGTALGDNIRYGAHVGGYLFGALMWLSVRRLGVSCLEKNIMTQRLKWVWIAILLLLT